MKIKVLPAEEEQIRETIRHKLIEIKQRNPNYSLRSLAQKLKINPGTLSAFLKGNRSFSLDILHELLMGIDIDPLERKNLLEKTNSIMVEHLKHQSSPSEIIKLSSSQTDAINSMTCFEILSLLGTENFTTNLGWMAEQLNCSIGLIQGSIERLVELGLVQIDADNQLSRTHKKITTTDDVANNNLKQLNTAAIEKAKASIYKTPVERRDTTFLVMPANVEKIDQAKELIRKFQDDMMSLLEQAPMTEVYTLSIQLVPAKL